MKRKNPIDAETLAYETSTYVRFAAKIERLNMSDVTPDDAIRAVRNYVTFLDYEGTDGVYKLCHAYRFDFVGIDIRSPTVFVFDYTGYSIPQMKALFKNAVLIALSNLMRNDITDEFAKRQIMTVNSLLKTFHTWYLTTDEGKERHDSNTKKLAECLRRGATNEILRNLQ